MPKIYKYFGIVFLDELTEEHQFSSEMRIEDGNLVWGNNWLISFDVMNYYHGDLFGYYE